MKLAIVGGRDFDDYEKMTVWMDDYFCGYEDSCSLDEIISGGAKGADTLATNYARNCGLRYTELFPNWDKFGKSAGFRRNQQIVDACDMVLAFWDGKSRGTKDTIDKARIAKIPTFIVYY